MSALLFIGFVAFAILLWAAASRGPRHISSPTTVSQTGTNHGFDPRRGVEEHGLCVCDPRPESSAIGECPSCHRLDPGKAYA